ncbi:hypothetical protein FRC10_004820, partial [Ceratobasidium sp. 414]
MPELNLSPRSSRTRRPTKRFEEYDEGGLTSLSKSVGRAVPLAELKGLQAAEQTKKQKGIASARGNATQPSPLPPLPKRRKPDNDGPLTDRRYGSLTSKEDQIEWLCQAIEAFGDLTNYRDDPEFQDPAVLYEVYEDLCDSERANDPLPPTSKAGNEIRVGMTKVLEYNTSGRKAAPKLVRTDHTTIGLDGIPVNTPNRQEFGQPAALKLTRTDHTTIGLDGIPVNTPNRQEFGRPAAPKLTRTDHTTLGLDGTPPSPPRTNVVNHRPTSTHSTPVQTVSLLTSHIGAGLTNKLAPLQKRAIVPRARVEALRRESNARGKETKGPASGPSTSARDPRDSPKGAPSTKARMVHAVSPEVEEREYDEDMDDNMEEGEVGEAVAPVEDDEGGDGENSEQGNSRARQQLASFGPAAPVVERVVQKVRVEMAVVCGFPEFVKSTEDPTSTYFDLWIPRLWAEANDELRPNQPCFELEDRHVRYIRRQLAPIRTSIKKCAEPMMESYFGLDHSEPDHVEKSRHLTGEEKWLSPTLKNDEKMFQHKIIGNTIAHAFFRSGRGIGVKHRDRFTPLIPIATIAYVCAIIRHLVKSYEFDNPKAANLKADEDADTY